MRQRAHASAKRVSFSLPAGFSPADGVAADGVAEVIIVVLSTIRL